MTMTILVRWGYRGAPSGERYIPPGEYDENDESLFGLADYLLANGHAVAMEQKDDRGKSEVVLEVEEVAPVVTRPRSRGKK
jgi:hypothetical protein